MASLLCLSLSFCLFTKLFQYLQYIYSYVCQWPYFSLLSVVCAQWEEDAAGLWKAFTAGKCVCVWTAYFRTFSLADFDAVLKRGLLAKKGSWVKFTVVWAPWALICDPPVFVFCGSTILSSGWMDDTCPPRFVYMAAFFPGQKYDRVQLLQMWPDLRAKVTGSGSKSHFLAPMCIWPEDDSRRWYLHAHVFV